MLNRRRVGARAVALTAIAFLVYVVLFIFLYPRMGSGAAALAGLPVLAGSWLLGLAGGILSAIVSIFLSAGLLALYGEAGLQLMFGRGGTAGSLMALALGAAVGYARTLHDRYIQEIVASSGAEAALRSSEAHFRTLFEESPLGISLVDKDDSFLQVNARLCEMLGYSEEELKGMTFPEITHPDDVAINAERTGRLNAGKIPRFDIEKRYIRKDGIPIWVHLTVSTIRDENGLIKYYLGMVEDIGERKRNEQALRQRNRELQVLNNVIAATTSESEPRVVLETACRELAQAFDLPQAGAALLDESGEWLEVVAQYMAGDVPNGIGQRIPVAGNWATEKVLRDRRPVVVSDARSDERMAQVHDLMCRWNIYSIMLLPLQVNGEVVGTIGLDSNTPRDFTKNEIQLAATAAAAAGQALERARLYEATATQARQMQQVVDFVPVGLLLLDRERKVALANKQAEVTLTCAGAYDGEGRLEQFGNASIARLLQPPQAGGRFHEVRVGENVETIFEVRAAGIDGSGWALALHDVTVEREQQRHMQAQERLAAIGQLSAGIAHDFNNILGVIIIYAEMLQREILPPHVVQRLVVIHEQAQRASHLVQQILDFSRKSVMRREVIDLLALLEKQIGLLRRTLPETIDISLETEPGYEYRIEGDVTRLQQALMNLAVNARDAMPDGGWLRFALSYLGEEVDSALPEGEDEEWIRLQVVDSGTGIPHESVPHIFEPFYTTKAPGEGSGLGLAQVYGIVNQHEGHIDVETEVGRGTKFSIYLPALVSETEGVTVD